MKSPISSHETFERLQTFKAFTVNHPKLCVARDTLLNELSSPDPSPLIFLVGPTGSGKSKTLDLVCDRVIADLIPALKQDRELFPVVMVEAPAPESARYPFIALYRRILLACEGTRVGNADQFAGMRSPHRYVSPTGNGLDGLQIAVENALRRRRPTAVILDEAEHLGRVRNEDMLKGRLNLIKTLAGRSEVPYVLASSYGIIDVMNMSSQVIRRRKIVHLARYHHGNEKDQRDFLGVAKAFAVTLGMQNLEGLLDRTDELFLGSVGCVGLLKQWFSEAYKLSLSDNRPIPTWNDFDSCMRPKKESLTLLQECMKGESELSDSFKDDADLRKGILLGESVNPEPNRKSKQAKGGQNLAVGRSKRTRAPLPSEPYAEA